MRFSQLPPPVTRGFISHSLPIAIILLASVQAAAPQRRACDYQSTQQMFDMAKYSLDGCSRLQSLAQIFGDGSATATQAQKLTATRFITASFVFTGTVTHVRKDPSIATGAVYEIAVQPRCFIKGRLQPNGGDSSVTVVGFQPSVESGLCLPISAEVGDAGLFFATVTGSLNGSPVVRINENGFARQGVEMQDALDALRCRENSLSLTPVPVLGDGGVGCRPINASHLPCSVSLDAAKEFLRRAFIVYEADLKPECQLGQEAVVQRIVKAPTDLGDANAGKSIESQRTSCLIEIAVLIYIGAQIRAI